MPRWDGTQATFSGTESSRRLYKENIMDTEMIKQMAESVNNVVLATANPYQEQIKQLQAESNRLKSALRVAETFLRVHKGTVEILKQIEFLKRGTKR